MLENSLPALIPFLFKGDSYFFAPHFIMAFYLTIDRQVRYHDQ